MRESRARVQPQTSPTLMGARELLADATPDPPTPETTTVVTSIAQDAKPVHSLMNRFTSTPPVGLTPPRPFAHGRQFVRLTDCGRYLRPACPVTRGTL